MFHEPSQLAASAGLPCQTEQCLLQHCLDAAHLSTPPGLHSNSDRSLYFIIGHHCSACETASKQYKAGQAEASCWPARTHRHTLLTHVNPVLP